ncbi:hypothetical protein JCM19301_2915 [Jejuia pallidilutea]|uniref:Uncharacterized protein n=1 Tax=Jejuia pallidilutea TaxID=504487 RepID=A0A090W0K4_9FLAO|nr:hypothetical protein JCM19301_2915 [Jejuia pallidilutea]GAL89635.1 hypothetical protein JCM19538_1259 [Jejuia pallidilutea]
MGFTKPYIYQVLIKKRINYQLLRFRGFTGIDYLRKYL